MNPPSNTAVIEVSGHKFMELLDLNSVTLADHWDPLPDGTTKPDQCLRITARQIVLEDGTVIQFTKQ